MKRSLQILISALLTTVLASCTVDVSDENIAPKGQTTDAGRSLSFGFSPKTYAVETWQMEKRLTTVAVFINVEGRGFYRFFSTEAIGSPLGFENVEYLTDPVDKSAIVNATVTIPADVYHYTNVAIVGNYTNTDPIADITDELMAVRSWDELIAFKAPASPNGVRLTPGHLSFKILTEPEIRQLEELPETGSFAIELKRLAARIRPELNVQVKIDGQAPYSIDWHTLRNMDENFNLFTFERLLFYNPKGGAYLFPEVIPIADRMAIPQIERFDLRFSGDSRDFYTYEMTGDEANPLMMYVIYKYRPNTSSPYQQGMAGIVITGRETGKCILEYNHAYEVVFDIPVPIPASAVDWNTKWLVGRP